MKRLLLSIACAIILVSCTYYLITKVTAKTELNTQLEEEKTFVITSRGEDYLQFGGKGAQVGERITALPVVDIRGKEVHAVGSRKILLVFASSYLEMYYPLLQEWAKTYQELLEVILVCREQPVPGLTDRLNTAGVHLVMDNSALVAKVDPGNLNFSYLINEEGEIVYRFRFLAHLWRDLSRDIDLFARKSIIPSGLARPDLALGEPFKLSPNCGWAEDISQKASIIFLLNSEDPVSAHLQPLAEALHDRYAEEVNVSLVYSTYSELNENIIKEYFERYGMQEEFAGWKASWQVATKADSAVLESIPVYFDQNRYVFDHPAIWMTPTVLIINHEGRLVDILGIGLDGGLGLLDLEDMIHKQLTKAR